MEVKKREITRILVDIKQENLTAAEKEYFSRMLTTFRAVGIQVLAFPEERHELEALNVEQDLIGLVDTEMALLLLKSNNLPVVYYSHICQGGFGADMLLMSFQEIGLDFFQQIFDRHYGQPWIIGETKRCVIRETMLADLDAFYEIYAQPSVAAFLEPLSQDRAEEQTKLRAYIRNQYPFYGFGTWTILDGDTGAVIGRAGLELRDDRPGLELGYLIREEYQGQGIAREVCERILEYARKDLEETEIYVRIAKENTRSLRLAEGLGLQIYLQETEKQRNRSK